MADIAPQLGSNPDSVIKKHEALDRTPPSTSGVQNLRLLVAAGLFSAMNLGCSAFGSDSNTAGDGSVVDANSDDSSVITPFIPDGAVKPEDGGDGGTVQEDGSITDAGLDGNIVAGDTGIDTGVDAGPQGKLYEAVGINENIDILVSTSTTATVYYASGLTKPFLAKGLFPLKNGDIVTIWSKSPATTNRVGFMVGGGVSVMNAQFKCGAAVNQAQSEAEAFGAGFGAQANPGAPNVDESNAAVCANKWVYQNKF